MPSSNQSLLSFNVNQPENHKSNSSDLIIEEQLKEIIERKIKEIYDKKINLLEKSIQELNEKIHKDYIEKEEKIVNLSNKLVSLQTENEKMLQLINELKERNEKLAESVSKLEKNNQLLKIESFEIKFVSSYNLEDNADKMHEKVSIQSANKNIKKVKNKKFNENYINYNIRNDNFDSEEKIGLDSTINTLGDGLLSLLKSVRRPNIKNNHHINTSKNDNKNTDDKQFDQK
jgi:hypothetical protein